MRNKKTTKRNKTTEVKNNKQTKKSLLEKLNYQEEQLQEAYKKISNTQAMLFHVEKMVAVGQLAGGVAHEVKNPLAIILQGMDYLQKNDKADRQEQIKIMDIVKDAVIRADKVIQALLDFSKESPLTLKPAALRESIESALDLIEQRLTLKNIVVNRLFSAGSNPVMMDINQVEQVFINLSLNSLQAMPEGGELTFRTYIKEITEIGAGAGRRVTDLFKIGDRALICEVEDTGQGISKDKLNIIFNPFYTTRPPGQGTGLGLSIARTIVERHGGLIGISSEEGVGTKVTITLPLAKDE